MVRTRMNCIHHQPFMERFETGIQTFILRFNEMEFHLKIHFLFTQKTITSFKFNVIDNVTFENKVSD